MKKLILCISLFISVIAVRSQTTIWINNMVAGAGQITVPVYVTGFNSIQSMSFILSYTTNLTYVGTQNINPGFNGSVVVSNATQDNHLNFAATQADCISIPNGSALFDLVFDFTGGPATITWDPGSNVVSCITNIPAVFIPGYINTTVGVNEIAGQSIHCYPNPVRDNLNISGLGEEPGRYSILTIEGRSLLKGHFTPNHSARIDVSHIPAGMYLLRIEDVAGNVVSRKVVIQ